LAVRLGADLAAAVPFYGAPPPAEDVPKIKAAVLVHHGELDKKLAATWPAYDAALKAANLQYMGTVKVRHLLDVIVREIGEREVRAKVTKPLSGLKVAPYYGCQFTRPLGDYDLLAVTKYPHNNIIIYEE
jgi:hypothetical protein